MTLHPITRFQRSLNYDTPPGLEVAAGSQGKIVRLSGQWTALALARDRATGKVIPQLRSLIDAPEIRQWDLSRIDRMDHVGGQALWRVWGHKMPADTTLNDTQRDIFERIALLDTVRDVAEPVVKFDPFTRLGLAIFSFFEHLYGGVGMLGRVVLDLLAIVRKPSSRRGPRSRRISTTRARRRCRSPRWSRS